MSVPNFLVGLAVSSVDRTCNRGVKNDGKIRCKVATNRCIIYDYLHLSHRICQFLPSLSPRSEELDVASPIGNIVCLCSGGQPRGSGTLSGSFSGQSGYDSGMLCSVGLDIVAYVSTILPIVLFPVLPDLTVTLSSTINMSLGLRFMPPLIVGVSAISWKNSRLAMLALRMGTLVEYLCILCLLVNVETECASELLRDRPRRAGSGAAGRGPASESLLGGIGNESTLTSEIFRLFILRGPSRLMLMSVDLFGYLLRPYRLPLYPNLLRIVEPFRTGHTRTASNLRVGRLVQIMPTFNSMVDQIATDVLSQVTFVELAYFMSDWRRNTLTTVTNVPTKNINPTLTFFFQCSFSPGSWERGIASIQTSRATLTAALERKS